MKMILGLIASLALAQSAMACDSNPPPNCYCKNNQWYSNVTNTVYNTTNNTVNGVNGNVSPVATAGAGATSTSNAVGGNATANGSVANSGNSANTNTQSLNNSGNNASTSSVNVAKGAVQGGAGGQGGQGGQGGKATIGAGAGSSSNVNSVTGGTATASIAPGAVQNTVGSNASVGTVSTGASTSAAEATANGNGSGNGNGNAVTFEAAKTYRAPVATAYASSLTSGADTCLGSISGGAQTQILGLTIGGTKRDKGCDLIKQTHLLMELQQSRAACIRAQLKEEGALIKEAMKEAGAECPPLVAPPVEAPVVVTTPPDAVTHAELRLIEDRITTKIVSK